MPSYPPVRSIERVIDLLQCLNRQPISTLDILHKQTGLPKSSLVRLLQTLVARGLVNHAPQHGAYYLTSAVRTLSSGYHSEPRIIEAAAPIADALTTKFKWPVSIAVFDTDAVVVRYSTIAQSPLSMLHSSINLRLSMVSRSLGRAHLAFCDADEQKLLLKLLQKSRDPDDQPAQDTATVQTMLDETRKRGYALRKPEASTASNTIAVPIFECGRVIATLGMTWFASALSQEEVVARILPHLLTSSQKISARLVSLSAPPPERKARAGKGAGRSTQLPKPQLKKMLL